MVMTAPYPISASNHASFVAMRVNVASVLESASTQPAPRDVPPCQTTPFTSPAGTATGMRDGAVPSMGRLVSSKMCSHMSEPELLSALALRSVQGAALTTWLFSSADEPTLV